MRTPCSALFIVTLVIGCGDPPAPSPDTNPATSASPTVATTATATATAATPTADPTVTAASAATTDPTADPTATTEPPASATTKVGATTAPSTGPGTTDPAPTATASATASAPLKDVTGEEKKGASYSAYMSGAGSYKAGQQGAVTAVVNALGDYKVNDAYPYKFTLNAAPGGVTYPETVVRNVSKGGKRAAISIPFSASSAGSYTISGIYSLSVCTDSNCVVEKVPLAVTVKVE